MIQCWRSRGFTLSDTHNGKMLCDYNKLLEKHIDKTINSPLLLLTLHRWHHHLQTETDIERMTCPIIAFYVRMKIEN